MISLVHSNTFFGMTPLFFCQNLWETVRSKNCIFSFSGNHLFFISLFWIISNTHWYERLFWSKDCIFSFSGNYLFFFSLHYQSKHYLFNVGGVVWNMNICPFFLYQSCILSFLGITNPTIKQVHVYRLCTLCK